MCFIPAEVLRFIVIKLSANALTFCEPRRYIFMIAKLQIKGFYFFSKLLLKSKNYSYD